MYTNDSTIHKFDSLLTIPLCAANRSSEKTGTTLQREITWTGFNMPSRIAKGNLTIDFVYGAA